MLSLMQFPQKIIDLLFDRNVKSDGRLIQKKNRRLMKKGSGKISTDTLSERKFPRRLIEKRIQFQKLTKMRKVSIVGFCGNLLDAF